MSSVRQRTSSPNAAERRNNDDENASVIPREILEVIEKKRTRDVLKMTAFCLLPTSIIIFAKGFVNEDMSGVSVYNMDHGVRVGVRDNRALNPNRRSTHAREAKHVWFRY